MTIRLATLNDQAEIARLHCNSWHDTFIKLAPDLVKLRGDEYPRRFKAWGEFLQNEELFTYVALDNTEKIIGFAQGGKVRKDRNLATYDGELILLYVAPDKKGQGIGKSLINTVATHLKSQGHESMVVVSWSINQSARAVYEYLGATFIKEVVQEENGFDNSQTVYGWQNINTAIEATS